MKNTICRFILISFRLLDKERIIMLKLFDKVLLKTGETAYIVDVLEHSYVCDIEKASGTDTDFVDPDDIAKVL